MAASKKIQALRERRVFNSYEFYGGPASRIPHIGYYSDTGRGGLGQFWQVTRLGEDLNDGRGAWYQNDHHGGSHRTFSLFRSAGGTFAERKRAALEEALAWARERFGIEEWQRDPFGSYGPAEYVDRRLAELLDPAARREV
jgi:hypothetical protein